MCRATNTRIFVAHQPLSLCLAVVSFSFSAACSPEKGDRPVPDTSLVERERPTQDRLGSNELRVACLQASAYWRRQLEKGGRAISRPPFVLAGSLAENDLQRWHEQTLQPAACVLAKRFFRCPPDRPVTLLLFHDESTYRAEAERLFGDRALGRHGYYRPHLRTMVVNAASGRSVLLHELVHALMAFDFPEAPTWIREGLASMYEDCRIELDPPVLVPLRGARADTLRRAMLEGRLPSWESFFGTKNFGGPQAAIYYALARHFCLFLDHRGVLERVYRTIRDRQDGPVHAVQRALEVRSWDALDREFRNWVNAA